MRQRVLHLSEAAAAVLLMRRRDLLSAPAVVLWCFQRVLRPFAAAAVEAGYFQRDLHPFAVAVEAECFQTDLHPSWFVVAAAACCRTDPLLFVVVVVAVSRYQTILHPFQAGPPWTGQTTTCRRFLAAAAAAAAAVSCFAGSSWNSRRSLHSAAGAAGSKSQFQTGNPCSVVAKMRRREMFLTARAVGSLSMRQRVLLLLGVGPCCCR